MPTGTSARASDGRTPPVVRSATPTHPKRTTLVARMPKSVMTVSDSAPRAMASRVTPKSTPARAASTTARARVPPPSSGPLARTAPASATTTPAPWSVLGRSPASSPATTGTTAPSAAIGETTPIVPVARAV